MTISEGFERGPLGAIVTKEDTTFYEVNSWDLNNTTTPEGERNTVRYSDDAHLGNFSATIPPELVVPGSYNGTNQYFPLTWIAGDTVTTGDHEFEWFFKYRKNMGSFFGRYLYELQAGLLGAAVLDGEGYTNWPDWYTGVETDIHRTYDPPDVIWRQTTRGKDSYYSTFAPPPQDTWLRVHLTWTAAAITTTITNAATGAVYYDHAEPVPAGMGFASLNVYLTTTRYTTGADPTQYDCQFWIDGIGVASSIVGNPGPVRRRFAPGF